VKVVWTRLAEQRAIEAFEWIAAERPNAAAAWLLRALDRVAVLEAFPDLGRPVPELARPDYRQILVKPYRVVYHRRDTVVVVLTIRHVRQDWDPREVSAV
jgi:plasmid stabilization system protein ParE